MMTLPVNLGIDIFCVGHASAVIITLGGSGLVCQDGGRSGNLSAFQVEALDKTGAGGAFHGAFASGLAAGKNRQELLSCSSAAGVLCGRAYGARPGYTDRRVSAAVF